MHVRIREVSVLEKCLYLKGICIRDESVSERCLLDFIHNASTIYVCSHEALTVCLQIKFDSCKPKIFQIEQRNLNEKHSSLLF